MNEVLTWLERDGRAEVLLGLGQGLARRGQNLHTLLKATHPALAHRLRQLLREACTTVTDSRLEVGRRQEAVELLALGDFTAAREPLANLLDPRQPPALQLVAVRVLAGFPDFRVPGLLLAGWPTHSPAIRAEVVQALLGRPQWLGALLDALEKRRLTTADVPPARRALLLRHADPAVRTRAATLLGSATGQRKDVVTRYEKSLDLPGDAARGRLVFQRACTNCHRLDGLGQDVGPSLETVRHQAPTQVLTSILDPNREASPNYLEYLVTTRDGRVTSGVIVAETVTGVALRRAGGVQETVLRQDIEEMAGTNRSLMPEGLEQSITTQEMADLLAFLLGPRGERK
jgi:putative heme-binding domain-containing protein